MDHHFPTIHGKQFNFEIVNKNASKSHLFRDAQPTASKAFDLTIFLYLWNGLHLYHHDIMFTFSKAINRSGPNGIPGRPHAMGAPIYLLEDRYGAIFKAQGPVNACKAYGASPQSHTPRGQQREQNRGQRSSQWHAEVEKQISITMLF